MTHASAGQSPASEITWGPEIPVDGRPAGLPYGIDIRVLYSGRGVHSYWVHGVETEDRPCNWGGISSLCLPADHPAYAVLSYNAAHPDEQPFVPWAGAEEAPIEGDVEVLFLDGHTDGGPANCFNWSHEKLSGDIIAYRPRLAKPEAVGEDDEDEDLDRPLAHKLEVRRSYRNSVMIERMSVEEWRNWLVTHAEAGLPMLRDLGLIAEPETRLDRFARENGLSEETKAACAAYEAWRDGK